MTNNIYPSMFIRDATNILQFIWLPSANLVLCGAWASPGLQPPGFVAQTFPLDGTDSFVFRIEGLNLYVYCVGTSNLPVAVYTLSFNFIPTHVGVSANSDVGTAVIDFSDFTVTTY
jgi:hypothetical protein